MLINNETLPYEVPTPLCGFNLLRKIDNLSCVPACGRALNKRDFQICYHFGVNQLFDSEKVPRRHCLEWKLTERAATIKLNGNGTREGEIRILIAVLWHCTGNTRWKSRTGTARWCTWQSFFTKSMLKLKSERMQVEIQANESSTRRPKKQPAYQKLHSTKRSGFEKKHSLFKQRPFEELARKSGALAQPVMKAWKASLIKIEVFVEIYSNYTFREAANTKDLRSVPQLDTLMCRARVCELTQRRLSC